MCERQFLNNIFDYVNCIALSEDSGCAYVTVTNLQIYELQSLEDNKYKRIFVGVNVLNRARQLQSPSHWKNSSGNNIHRTNIVKFHQDINEDERANK